MDVLVARIGKAHGLRGEVTVQLHTDVPEERFAAGAALTTEPGRGVLHVRSARVHNGIWLVAFDEAPDRTAAEALRGTRLSVVADDEGEDDDEGWYETELVGLEVRDTSGRAIGRVTGLDVRAAQDLLGIELADGRTGQVPFVEALVPEVDVAGGYVVVDPPEGLFDLED